MPTLKKVPAYQDGEGKLHLSVESWKEAELDALWHRSFSGNSEVDTNTVRDCFIAMCREQGEALVGILTTGPTSRPGVRKRAGTTSPRRAAKRATEAQATAGFKAMREAAGVSERDLNAMRGGTNATHDADVPAEPAAA